VPVDVVIPFYYVMVLVFVIVSSHVM
jgi:hypothetical protein